LDGNLFRLSWSGQPLALGFVSWCLTHPGSRIGAVYLCRDPIDFRNSIDGLSAFVEQGFCLNPFGDSLFVFTNRGRYKNKALY
jgi:hypothetical protein